MRFSWVHFASSVALSCAAHAQTYDFSAATAQLSNNLALYSGGVFVQVFQDDTEIFTYQGGGAIGLDTQVRLGSCTKWFSAAIVLRLAERGLFNLDDPIGNYLPIFNTYGKGHATIRQCFSMTSGLYETGVDYETAPMLSLTQSVNRIAINTPFVFPPGTQLAYEGDGMQIVGRICEVVTDKDWHTLAQDELFTPLGLTQSDYRNWIANPGIPGGARSTARAYQKFLRMILRNGLADDGSIYLTSRTVNEWFTNRTRDLPEYDAPWPAHAYPYGARPGILAHNPINNLVEEVTSPGAYGTFPWVDVKRRLRGIIEMNSALGSPLLNNLRVLDALRAEIDRVGVPPPPRHPFTLEPMGNFFQLRWPAGTLETSQDLSLWAPLPWARSPFHARPAESGVMRLFYRIRE
jgi:CubicO group peptidase (beta-lactamase class C family)